MSESNPVQSVTNAQATQSAQSGENTAPNGTPGNFNASTTVGSMAELQSKAPELYKAMMEGIATKIINEMRDHQQRLKEMQRQAQREAEGKE